MFVLMCRLLYIVLALKTSKFDTFLLSWRAHTDFEKDVVSVWL